MRHNVNLDENSMKTHLIFNGGAIAKSSRKFLGEWGNLAKVRYVPLQLLECTAHKWIHSHHVSLFGSKKCIICQILQHFSHENQVSPTALIYRAMIKTESVRWRNVRNNHPEKPVSSGNNVFALGKKFFNTSLKNGNKTANGRRHSVDWREEGLDYLGESVRLLFHFNFFLWNICNTWSHFSPKISACCATSIFAVIFDGSSSNCGPSMRDSTTELRVSAK